MNARNEHSDGESELSLHSPSKICGDCVYFMRLLLVEDDVELAQSLVEQFRDLGYEVTHVADAIQ